MTEQSWVDKYRPDSWGDIYGNNKTVKNVKKWSKNFTPGDEAQLFHGPPGTGKTSLAEVIKEENGWPIEEINASSARTTSDIESFASQIRNKPVSAEYKVVLVDEADSFPRSASLKPLSKVLQSPPNPIILTANDSYSVPNSLSSKCNERKFSLRKGTKKNIVEDIAEQEGIELSNQEIGKLATRQDARSIINDLQRFAETGDEIGWDERENEISEWDAVDNILKGKKFTGDITPADLVPWLDENVSIEYQGVEAMRAYQALAQADRWLEHTNKTQDYSWWKYAGTVAEEVADMRLTEVYGDYINKDFPEQFRQSRSSPDDSSPESSLYRDLKGYDVPGFKASFSFQEFKNTILPLLQSLDKEEKMQICLTESLSTDSFKALGVTKTEYEDWMYSEVQESEQSTFDDVSETEETEDDEGQGLFDF